MDSYSSPENLESRRCRSKEAQSGNEASKKRKQELFENEKRVVRVKVEAVTNGEGDADHQKQKHKSELGSPPPPPDSWSWRKYGQKPIKGSPYPWGYYRCSTGKGCLAKKQVERCKEDASVFIITYTSPHNHNRTSHAGPMANSSTQKHRPQSPDKRTHSSNNTHTRVEHQHSSSNAMPMAKQEAQEPEPYVVSLDGITPLPLPLSHHDQHHPFASYDLKSHPASSRKLEDQNYDFFDELELDL